MEEAQDNVMVNRKQKDKQWSTKHYTDWTKKVATLFNNSCYYKR